LRAGELIYVSTCHAVTRGSGAEPSAARMALVMVQSDQQDSARAGASVRLVQDFGPPSDCPGTRQAAASTGADAPSAPVKRGRGRPPGSRTKKPAAVVQAQ
jgi:hypothetical protein